MKTWGKGSILSLFLIFSAGSSQAALLSRLEGQAVYDTDLDVTWVSIANLASFDDLGVSGITGGTMDFYSAYLWLQALNDLDYLGFSDWRLPRAANRDGSGFCEGSFCPDSEMGHLFHVESISTLNQSPFQFVSKRGYWYEDRPAFDFFRRWTFDFVSGNQTGEFTSCLFSCSPPKHAVWAVRDGDVSPVPLPPAVLLFTSALISLVAVARKGGDPRQSA